MHIWIFKSFLFIFIFGVTVSCENTEDTAANTGGDTKAKEECINLANSHTECLFKITELNTDQTQAWENCEKKSLQYIEQNIKSQSMKEELQAIIHDTIDEKLEKIIAANKFQIGGEEWVSGHVNVDKCGGMLKNVEFIVCSTAGKILKACS